MRRDLGTAKLTNLINSAELAEDSLVAEFLQQSLSTQLRLPTYLRGLQQLVFRLRGRRYLSEALLWLLRGVYFQRSLGKEEETEFAQVVSELYLDIRGLQGPGRVNARARLLQKFRKEKILDKLKKD
jgi:hypothetical protein